MRSLSTAVLVLTFGASPVFAQQISQSPLIGHKAGAACPHGPYPSPAGADNVSGDGLAGCIPGEVDRGLEPVGGGEAVTALRSAPPLSTAPEVGLFSELHNVER